MFECTKTVLYLNGISLGGNFSPNLDDVITCTPQKAFNEGMIVGATIFAAGKLGFNFISNQIEDLVTYNDNSHNLRGPITSIETERNNTSFHEVQILNDVDSLSGIVDFHPNDYLPSF